MAQATQLNASEQDTLVKQIGLAMLRTAPRDWKSISASYRTVGRYHELDGEITLAGGERLDWVATHDIANLFARLRSGMYREQRGTWFNARYQLDAPASYNLEYDRDEPQWNMLPPTQAYSDELRMFPRTDENIPEWLMRRLAGLGPQPIGPRFRIARVFDGTGQSGRPMINRTELDVDEQDRILTYLGGAPVVLPGRGYDIDRLASSPEPAVPVAFHSDGTWIWPAAVNYYLQEYGVSPEQELIDHIKANGHQMPEVSDTQRTAAREYLTHGPSTGPQPTAVAPAVPPVRLHTPAGEPAAGRHSAAADNPPEPDDRAAQAAVSTGYFDVRADQEANNNGGAEPVTEVEEPAISRLRAKLGELGVPDSAYAIGGPATHGWSIEEFAEGWRVGWYDESLTNPSVFATADDATAFLLGKLMLEPAGAESGKHGQPAPDAGDAEPATEVGAAVTHEPPPGPAPESVVPVLEPRRSVREPAPTLYGPAIRPSAAPAAAASAGRSAATSPAASGAPSAPGSWPIQPLAGEPPLTLFRGKHLEELPPGSELDRFGDPDGNLMYAAGTAFEERSVWPDWVHRPYHVYRVQQPLECLAGVAIPWFNQPGGGSAYILPTSVEELVAQRVLVELEPGDPPVD